MQQHIPAVAFRSLSQGEHNGSDFFPHSYFFPLVPTELLAWLLQSLARFTSALVDADESAAASDSVVLSQTIVTKVRLSLLDSATCFRA